MKIRSLCLLAFMPFVLLGCNPETPGGPGAAIQTKNKPMIGQQADNTFVLRDALIPTILKQGETKRASIIIMRGKNFDADVTLKFSSIPKGVSIYPESQVIKHSDTEAKFKVIASNSAAIGNFELVMTGRPSKGTDSTSAFKITVNKP